MRVQRMVYIICGVSGTGKSTVGKLLADQLDLPFYDADDFHSEVNKLKMASGIALTDADRMKWLKTLSAKILQWQKSDGAVLACSALKEIYREILMPFASSKIKWIILEGNKDLLLKRIQNRKEHFFSIDLLDSQFEIYERPKYGWVFNVQSTPDKIVADIINLI